MKHTLTLCTAIALLAAGTAFATPTVTFTGPTSVAPGGVLQLTVAASDFADLYAYQFDVTFNAAAFTAGSVTEGSLLSTMGTTFFDGGTADNADGTVTFVFNTLIGPGGGATGAGDLAQLTFNVAADFSGAGQFAIANFMALDSSLNAIDTTLQGITVSAVPEPSALALALAGLGFFAARRAARRDAA